MSAALAIEPTPTAPAQSRRRHDRTNTFLMALMVCEGFSAPARIKNMSKTGALLNTKQMPRVGEMCRLDRADVSIVAQVVRVTPQGAAVHFINPISVEDWIGSPTRHQSEIDRRVHQERHRYPVADSKHLASVARVTQFKLAPSRVSRNELVDMASALDRLADLLSDDPNVVARYGSRLQILDIAAQRLRALRNQ